MHQDAVYQANPEEYIDIPEDGHRMSSPPVTARGPPANHPMMPHPPPSARSPPPTARHQGPPSFNDQPSNHMPASRSAPNMQSGYNDYAPAPMTARGPGPRPPTQGQGDDEDPYTHPPMTARGGGGAPLTARGGAVPPPPRQQFYDDGSMHEPEYHQQHYEHGQRNPPVNPNYQTTGQQHQQESQYGQHVASDDRYEDRGKSPPQAPEDTTPPVTARGGLSSASHQRPSSGHGKLSPLSPTAPPQPLKPPSPGEASNVT